MSKYEFLGIIGMIFILVGFMSKKERTIRLFDMIGAMFFVLYGALTNTYSTLMLNAVLIVVNYVRLFCNKAK